MLHGGEVYLAAQVHHIFPSPRPKGRLCGLSDAETAGYGNSCGEASLTVVPRGKPPEDASSKVFDSEGSVLFLEFEAAADDHFEDEVVGIVCNADAEPEVEFPFRRNIKVDCRDELMFLLAQRVKPGNRADSPIVFNSAGN